MLRSQLLLTLFFSFSSVFALQHNNKPSKALLAICTETNLSHQNTLDSINKAAQDKDTGWIRKAAQERWENE